MNSKIIDQFYAFWNEVRKAEVYIKSSNWIGVQEHLNKAHDVLDLIRDVVHEEFLNSVEKEMKESARCGCVTDCEACGE